MVQTVYVVQTFSRDGSGRLVRDAPTWSQDRSFAVSLTRALAKRKAGVMTVGVTVASGDELGSEAEIVASHGTVPLEMILDAGRNGAEDVATVVEASVKRRA
jgi:hypothetical protein